MKFTEEDVRTASKYFRYACMIVDFAPKKGDEYEVKEDVVRICKKISLNDAATAKVVKAFQKNGDCWDYSDEVALIGALVKSTKKDDISVTAAKCALATARYIDREEALLHMYGLDDCIELLSLMETVKRHTNEKIPEDIKLPLTRGHERLSSYVDNNVNAIINLLEEL